MPELSGLGGAWKYVSGPNPFADDELPLQWGRLQYVTFETDDSGMGRLSIWGRFDSNDALECSTTGRWFPREQGDVWFEMNALGHPILRTMSLDDDRLVVGLDDGSDTVLRRVAEVPEAARCETAVDVTPWHVAQPGLNDVVGFDGLDLFVRGTPFPSIYAVSVEDAGVGGPVALHSYYKEVLQVTPEGMVATTNFRRELALLELPSVVVRTLELEDPAIDVDVRARLAARNGTDLLVVGASGAEQRLVTFDLGETPASVVSDIGVDVHYMELFVHQGVVWALQYQHGHTVLVELDRANGRAKRTVRIPVRGHARGLASVDDTVFTWMPAGLAGSLLSFRIARPDEELR